MKAMQVALPERLRLSHLLPTRLHHQILTDATPPDVWTVLRDPHRWPEFEAMLARVEGAGGHVAEGQRLLGVARGWPMRIPLDVRRVVPRKALHLTVYSVPGLREELDIMLVPATRGRHADHRPRPALRTAGDGRGPARVARLRDDRPTAREGRRAGAAATAAGDLRGRVSRPVRSVPDTARDGSASRTARPISTAGRRCTAASIRAPPSGRGPGCHDLPAGSHRWPAPVSRRTW